MRFFVVAATVLAVVSRVEAAKEASKFEGTARLTQENDIREAVFRYQFNHNSSIQGKSAAVYCLSVGEKNADPPDDLIRRFAAFKPPVRKASDWTRFFSRRVTTDAILPSAFRMLPQPMRLLEERNLRTGECRTLSVIAGFDSLEFRGKAS